MAELSVSFGREAYTAGGMVTFLVRGRSLPPDWVIFAQVHGHLQADLRWVKKVPSGLFAHTAAFPLEVHVPAPRPPVPFQATAPLVFVTPREVLSHSALLERNGVVVQFDLPADALPTFKGLCTTSSYNLAITVQPPSSPSVTRYFPFTVVSKGSSAAPSLVKFSPLSVFPASSLPVDSVLVPTQDGAQDGHDNGDDDNEAPPSSLQQQFRISSPRGQHVCVVSLIKSDLRGRIVGGGVLTVQLNFQQQQQEGAREICRVVRARLLQCETRLDGSRVQERALSAAARTTADCTTCSLALPVPQAVVCDGSSPLSRVSHVLEIRFLLVSDGGEGGERGEAGDGGEGGGGGDGEGESVMWTLPVVVDPPAPATSSVTEVNRALEPAIVVVEAV